MGKKIAQNVQEKFGDRFIAVYPDKPVSATERAIHYEAISKAVFQVLTGILGREPTEEEFSGAVDISKVAPRRKT